ncbi:ABC transporter substrate-binding protein [Frateuria defendens]|uniref:ABC transporter substrate-binding protein n=1 Tax=Frateuria defendens TaxID=2219559 RepID=UPI000A6F7A77|nr:ABC transporter substrate-binding protein [Frateuria defendens]
MLGQADHVVVTVAGPKAFPWMYRVAPQLSHATLVEGSTMNAEELLRLGTQLVFVAPADPSTPALQRAGLDVVKVGFNSFSSMLDCLAQTVQALDDPRATRRAEAYRDYLQQVLADTARRTAAIPPARRPRVLHVVSLAPLKVDGQGTIIDEWIQLAGGRNAAAGLHGNMQPVSIEQVLAWRPDLIILAADAGNLADTPQATLWRSLPAVQQGRVYHNPRGVFPWDRYGPELALQVLWAAQLLRSGQVDQADMQARVRDFYAHFFDYRLSDDEARRILAGLPPGP